MGIPGESRALDIAGRNGIGEDIIARARTYLAGERSDISELIRGLKHKHQELDQALRAGKDMETRIREERRRTDLKELRLRQKELDLKSGSLGTLRLFLSESRKTLENLVRELREGEITREKTLKVKDFLKDLEARTALQDKELEKEAAGLREERLAFEERESGGGVFRTGSERLYPGMEVLAGEARRRGTIVKAGKKGCWIVELGSVKISFPAGELFPVAASGAEKQRVSISSDLSGSVQPRLELNLRGMRLEEALESLKHQIDAASLAGLCEFAVIHGKGDGILQKGVHDFLKKQASVADYFFSRPEQGGFGRTEVVLKG
jgi:DNA mismatch repair protein MutS2